MAEQHDLTDEQCDRLVALTMDKLAAKNGIHALDLCDSLTNHHSLRRSIVRAAHMLGKQAATPAPEPTCDDATELALGKAYRTIAIDRPWLARDDFEVAYRAGLAATPAPADDLSSLRNRLRVAEESLERCRAVCNATAEQWRADVAATPAPAPKWQPIKTAPKDKWVLLREEELVWPGGFEDGKWHCPHPDFDGKPSHWMPLPTAPDQGKEAGKP